MELVYAPADILKKPTISVDDDMDNVVKLAEQMKGIPSVMDMKMLRKKITG